MDKKKKCIKACLQVVRSGSLLLLNFQLHDEILFLKKTTMYLFFNLSLTAMFIVVKLGRAEKPLGTAPGLCMSIFTLVRQSPIPQVVLPRRKIETSHPSQRMLLSNSEQTQGLLHICTKPNRECICSLGAFCISVLSNGSLFFPCPEHRHKEKSLATMLFALITGPTTSPYLETFEARLDQGLSNMV